MTGIISDLSNIPGWSFKRKLVIFESDDWGSIRMPSRESFKDLKASGIDLVNDEGYIYNKYDSLATSQDLEFLFEVLLSVNDISGRPAVLTPVSVVANPDFVKILKSDFTEYHFEPFIKTLGNYKNCEGSFKLWQEGVRNRLFIPQFHGREHLNVKTWMRALISKHRNTMRAFENRLWGITTANDPDIRLEFQAAFDYIDSHDLTYHEEVIRTGLDLFENIFSYRAEYFVPPNGPLSSKIENTCHNLGIRLLSVPKLRTEPMGSGKTRKRIHWLGQKGKTGLYYITRNCFFEPCVPGTDWVDRCLGQISKAFRWNKPAIISSHRVNYVGALYPENRDNGLRKLRLLLKKIKENWDDAEFITTIELEDIKRNG